MATTIQSNRLWFTTINSTINVRRGRKLVVELQRGCSTAGKRQWPARLRGYRFATRALARRRREAERLQAQWQADAHMHRTRWYADAHMDRNCH